MRLIAPLSGNLLAFWVMLYLSYALPLWLPGDYSSALYASSHVVLNSEQEALLAQNVSPIPTFFEYVTRLLRGDLGRSLAYGSPISTLLLEALPWTLALALSAQIFAFVLGLFLGVEAIFRHGSPLERGLFHALVALESIPEIVLGVGLWLFLALFWGIFPLQGGEEPYSTQKGLARLLELGYYGFLPFLTLTLSYLPSYFLLTRAALLPQMGAPYLKSAATRGIAPSRLRYIHALPNALMPLLTRLTLRLPLMLFGVVLIEGIFSYPGIGSLLLSAIAKRDPALIQAIILLLALLVMLANSALYLLAFRFEPKNLASFKANR